MKLRSLIKKERKFIPKNKRGAIGIIIFFMALMLVLVLGFIAAMAWSVLDIASDEITPIMEELGMAGDANLSQASEYSFGVANTFVQAMPWLIALGYVMALIFTLVFVFIVGYNPHPAFIGFYLVLMILLIFLCIIMSNMYQDIYTGDDEISSRLQEQDTLSYLILHSPFIMALIAVIGGILMFARQAGSEAGGGGGFGV